MAYLKKTWIRIVISLVVAAVGLELMLVATLNPNVHPQPRPGSMALLIVAAVIYLLLTAYVKRRSKQY